MTNFQKIRSDFIPILQATVEQYLEEETGVRHVHVANKQEELAFLVGFPTVPTVSDGRAHILEHLALCGSQAYPVSDPFFSMLRRSTATFMNAMTYADRTVYPYASTDKTDFFNLMDVYLDATFFPKLDYLSFRQEGWRYTYKDGKLGYQGVVFNEMKGTLNSPMRTLHFGINQLLLEGSTYAFDSGGDPLVIPNLTHQMLQEFHASHYHPSQAMFMTAGAISAVEIQERIADRVLSKTRGKTAPRVPQLVPGWTSPRRADILVPSQEARPDEFGFQLAWLLGESSDPRSAIEAFLLMQGLLGESSAPVMKVMQSAGFGRPSQMNGSSSEARQIIFHLGMEGLTEEQVELAHTCIRDALTRTAELGVPRSVLKAALRNLRFEQRKIRGGGIPDGLSRLLDAVPVLMCGGDVLTAFDNDALLDQLEREIDDPNYFKQLVRNLIGNQSCLISRVVPDAQFFAKRDAMERAQLTAHETQMSDADRLKIQADSAALDAAQDKVHDTSVLPRIRPEDVSPDVKKLTALQDEQQGFVTAEIPSNGIAYADLFYDVSRLPEGDWPWLSLYAQLVPELGVGKLAYDEASAWRQTLVPVFGVSFEPRLHAQELAPTIRYAASGLREDQASIAEALRTWTSDVRFDEMGRLRFLIESGIESKLTNVPQVSNQFASFSAGAPLSPRLHFQDVVYGKSSLPFCAELRSMLARAGGLKAIADKLLEIHAQVLASPRTVLCAGLTGDAAKLAQLLEMPQAVSMPVEPPKLASTAMQPANLALVISSQVNHCAIAWAAPHMSDAGSAALAVAAELMTNNILHQSLREKGGAYGGTASYSEEDGVFSMSSFRDPRLAETYADFQAALDRVLVESFSDESLEEAKICVIKRLDKPLSPYLEAVRSWTLQRRGISTAQRQAFRQGVLTCDLSQVKVAVKRWLKEGISSRAAAVGSEDRDLAGLAPVNLLALAS